MSRRWRGPLSESSPENTGEIDYERLDIAGKYAVLLETMHKKALEGPDMPTDDLFLFDIASDLQEMRSQPFTSRLMTPNLSETNPSRIILSTTTNNHVTVGSRSPAAIWGAQTSAGGPQPESNQVYKQTTAHTKDSENQFENLLSPKSTSVPHTLFSRAENAHEIPTTVTPPTNHPFAARHLTRGSSVHPISMNNVPTGEVVSEVTEDDLAAITNGLLDQNFSSLDRVITLDGTDFNFDMSYWGSD